MSGDYKLTDGLIKKWGYIVQKWTILNPFLIVFKASESVVDIGLDLFGGHSLGDLSKDTQHPFGILDLAVALLFHLLNYLFFFLDVHHESITSDFSI